MIKIKDETDPKKLIERLVDRADYESLLLDTHDKRELWRRGPYYMPGGMIEALSPEEREAIKTLKPEHCQNLRPDGISWKNRKITKEGC